MIGAAYFALAKPPGARQPRSGPALGSVPQTTAGLTNLGHSRISGKPAQKCLFAGCMQGVAALTCGPDLRTAIAQRDVADAAHWNAEAELSACRTTIAEIENTLSDLTEGEDEKTDRAQDNFRAGQLGTGTNFDAELDREVEQLRLDDARRAERVLAAAVGEAHALLLNARERVEGTAAALVVMQIDTFAAALEETEQRAAKLRTLLLSVGSTWLTAPGMVPLPLQATERMRRLAMAPPANATATTDRAITAAFLKHFAELLTDPDASLAAGELDVP
jgi:hypothetical protein